jgi:inhibitor of KinA sporulation pathway (predicted exonuclease)
MPVYSATNIVLYSFFLAELDASMEDLKQTLDMMKDMKDSGQVSEAELVEIRKQFKDLYGSDVSGLIKKAEEEGTAGGMTDDEKELLDMFKWILGEE